MEIYDIITDTDAYIDGVILEKTKDGYHVLWNNLVYGTVTEDMEEIKVKGHLNLQKFYTVDILHTGHHGVEFESKIGKKYEVRKNKVMFLDMDTLLPGKYLGLFLFKKEDLDGINPEKASEIWGYKVSTTAFEKFYEKDGYFYLRTLNSIYKLKKM